MEESDDQPQLSQATLAALQQFYEEQRLHDLENESPKSNKLISENWQLSQFWYNQDTIRALTKIVINTTGTNGKIALISCPSLYNTIKRNLGLNGEVHLYEYDTRFSVFGNDFNYYDYKNPLDIPKDKKQYYDLVVGDPPFISIECLEKVAVTINYFAKKKVILCTGEVMENHAKKLLQVTKTSFQPEHEHNLANEFSCYANYPIEY